MSSTYLTSSRNLSSSKGDTWEYLQEVKKHTVEQSECCASHVMSRYSQVTKDTRCVILLELNSLSVFMFNLCHDSVGVKGFGFLFHTVFWEQVCRCKKKSLDISQLMSSQNLFFFYQNLKLLECMPKLANILYNP